MKKLTIAIDGPAGSGKSTVAKKVAEELDILYIDTGAMYRAIGVSCQDRGVDTKCEPEVLSLLSGLNIKVYPSRNGQSIEMNGVDITPKLRTSAAGKAASDVALLPAVREKLVAIQQNIAKDVSVVMDGRDIASHVLPNADYKFFLTASVDSRARRRLQEFHLPETEEMLQMVKNEVINRDSQDKNRKCSPLIQVKEAVLIDTTELTIEQVVEKILAQLTDR